MKEIDLIPEWYKNSRKQRKAVYVQYVALAVVFAVMAISTLFANGAVKKAQAELFQLEAKRVAAEKDVKGYSELSDQLEQLRQKMALVEKVDSRLDVPSILAELSFLIDDNILLERLTFSAERFDKAKGKTPTKDNKNFQISRPEQETLAGSVRFAVTMSGIAADAGKVADLICRLEESPYFCQVVPLYTEDKKNKNENVFAGNRSQITEFEIGCFLANYKEQ
jgi:Tfp pilus assembly protein PilN